MLERDGKVCEGEVAQKMLQVLFNRAWPAVVPTDASPVHREKGIIDMAKRSMADAPLDRFKESKGTNPRASPHGSGWSGPAIALVVLWTFAGSRAHSRKPGHGRPKAT